MGEAAGDRAEKIVTHSRSPMVLMDFFALAVAIICALVGAGIVISGALLIRRISSNNSVLLPRHLVISHSLTISMFMVLGLTGISIPSEPFDDICGLYFLVPGIHILFVGGKIAVACSPTFFKMFSNHEASMIGIVIIPGMTGLILGGLQWYLLGYLFQNTRIPVSKN
jgi:hypothetical protein